MPTINDSIPLLKGVGPAFAVTEKPASSRSTHSAFVLLRKYIDFAPQPLHRRASAPYDVECCVRATTVLQKEPARRVKGGS